METIFLIPEAIFHIYTLKLVLVDPHSSVSNFHIRVVTVQTWEAAPHNIGLKLY